jgi:hypothetical protein
MLHAAFASSIAWEAGRALRGEQLHAFSERKDRMPNGDVLRGSIEKTGEGSFEIVNLKLDIDEAARGEIEADPRGAVQRFLESEGHTVNRIVITDPSPDGLANSQWHHTLFPKEMWSTWTQW